ncbi:SUR7/PalI family [Geosmithia morbida]|uniref:SUR7/PalI family n=1 Tax=Geosmithia morbida TaxID=1094350 RepID=A0A9P4Z0D9_9HYPO|nr:SUR7/PalI family [Geosmithia morbida]KAF4125111.1 SUR7/PalI family [Geosmithia morbida]
MRPGRFVCVGIPLVLTIGAIIAFMVATLSGITHNGLFIFSIDLSKFDLDTDTLSSLASSLGLDLRRRADSSSSSTGLTASDLGLGDEYEISLWGYCEIDSDGNRDCTKGEYNWASKHIRSDFLDNLGSVSGVNITLPDELNTALNVFCTITRWTEIAFIASLASLGAVLLLGIFANCTRIMSCVTWLVGLVAIALSIAAAGLATAMATVVVAAVESQAKAYNVTGKISAGYLACVWIGVAFVLGATLFWLFSMCCCKPDHDSRRSRRRGDSVDDAEKLMPTGTYIPVGGNTTSNHHRDDSGEMITAYGGAAAGTGAGAAASYHNQFQPTYGEGYSHSPSIRSDGAYEPYKHRG